MRQFMRLVIIILTVLGLSPDVQAVPTFSWIEPWNVTLLPIVIGSAPLPEIERLVHQRRETVKFWTPRQIPLWQNLRRRRAPAMRALHFLANSCCRVPLKAGTFLSAVC